jgi:hypothetical protein
MLNLNENAAIFIPYTLLFFIMDSIFYFFIMDSIFYFFIMDSIFYRILLCLARKTSIIQPLHDHTQAMHLASDPAHQPPAVVPGN